MTQGRLILLTDLDDTLFASERALPADIKRDYPAAVDAKGLPLSFQTPQQRMLWQLLSPAADIIIPVTGRTSYALERVQLPLHHRHAVVSHGALIVHEGSVLPEWQAYLDGQIDAAHQMLSEAHTTLRTALSHHFPEVSCRVLEDLQVPVYLSLKAPDVLPTELHVLLEEVAAQYGLNLHANRRNAALRPPYASKAATCAFLLEHVIQRQPHDTVISLGDSLSDLPFMATADMAIVPTRSQIWDVLKEASQ